ncbi:MAG TPA: polymorphic toxin-type HINT domain-containing protein, partial [Chthonomonadaceae bacterium]|nr:polymorphic toxin-type HINT domain-containing protein [Chthonomonadaceae bacterium]
MSASPVASRLHSKWRAGSVALLLLAVFALAWKFTPAPSASASTSSASAAPVALASLSDAPVETALLTPPLPLITPTNAPVPDAVKNALPASVPAQLGEPGAKLRRVVDKKIANGMVTLTLKDEQTGQLSTMTQPLGTNVSTVEAGGEEKVVASAPVVKPPDPVKDDFPTTGIEKVQAGMTVPTRNPITGKTEFKKVVRIFKHTVYEIVKLELTDGSPGKVVDSLRGTPQHPFFTPSGMVAMGELKPEMKVITRRGPPLVVKSVTREPHPQGIPVYNFEVEGDHT